MTNKVLKLEDYVSVGFDVDHTIAQYKLPALFECIHRSISTYLTEEKGYPTSIRDPIDRNFVMRGIVFDVSKGNFLKLSDDGTILRATHGTTFLPLNKVKEAYGSERHWPHWETLFNTVDNIGMDYRIFENFFDMPIMMSLARLIDLVDAGQVRDRKYSDICTDVYKAAGHTYNPSHFEKDLGGFFPDFKRNPSKYLHKCSDDVKAWLKSLRASGKTLFIATSSYNDFASLVLQYTIGDDWRDYFDFLFTFARKPGFFKHDERQFYIVENTREKEVADCLRASTLYSQGNAAAFTKKLQSLHDKSDPKVVFFGDSLRSDAYPAKQFANWDTVLVLEEMVDEKHDFAPETLVEPAGKRRRIDEPSSETKEYLTSHSWGSFFTDSDGSPSNGEPKRPRMNTLWGYMVRKYADVTIPQLEYVSTLQASHEFDTFQHDVQFKWGFYPGVPKALTE